MEKTLELGLTVSPRQSSRREEFRATVSVRNRSDEPVTLSLEPLDSASLALELRDPDGAPVLLPPPPIPREPGERAVLGPGESHRREFPSFVPQWTRAGVYRVRFSYGYRTEGGDEWQGAAASDWVALEVTD